MRPMKHILLLAVFLTTSTPAHAGALTERSCLPGREPAATLLFPYFEVEPDDPNGLATLLAITNARAAPTLAKVIIWSDWALPVFFFDLYLTGFDVETLNLRDVLQGKLPTTGAASSNRGNRSDPNSNFAECPSENVAEGNLDIGFIRAALTGQPVGDRCWASPTVPPGRMIGYITVDAVNECSSLLPGDEGYFGAGGTGVASNANTLLGDFYYVDPGENFAQGSTAVHLLADDEFFAPGDETFYARYEEGTAADARAPLSDRYGVRFLTGGAVNTATDLIVWRGITGEAPHEPPLCQLGGARLLAPAWLSHLEFKILFDEEENPVLLDSPISDDPTFRQATQKLPFFEFSPWDSGWADLTLGGQAWVAALVSAQGRFSLGVEAWALQDPCRQE